MYTLIKRHITKLCILIGTSFLLVAISILTPYHNWTNVLQASTKQTLPIFWQASTIQASAIKAQPVDANSEQSQTHQNYVELAALNIAPSRARIQLEAEAHNGQSGIETYDSIIGYLDPEDWIRIDQVNFGHGYTTMTVRYAKGNDTASYMDLHLDSLANPPIARFPTEFTGSWDTYVEVTIPFYTNSTSTHNIYFSFHDWGVGNIDWIVFK